MKPDEAKDFPLITRNLLFFQSHLPQVLPGLRLHSCVCANASIYRQPAALSYNCRETATNKKGHLSDLRRNGAPLEQKIKKYPRRISRFWESLRFWGTLRFRANGG